MQASGMWNTSKLVCKGLLPILFLSLSVASGGEASESCNKADFSVHPFGSGGQLKMIYDRRQRPQAVYINDMVYMVYNGGASMGAVKKEKTHPFIVSYNPAFLHVLSEDSPEKFNYYYVRYVDGAWKQTAITHSNHEWNSGYLKRDNEGMLSAYLIVGNNEYTSEAGKMDSRGGGDIEEWRSADHGNTWRKVRDLTPRHPEFTGWKFNNIQPIKDPAGKAKAGMYLFYGWKDSHLAKGTAFLLVE